MRDINMKQLVQTLQYIGVATAVFVSFYLSYILIAGMYAFVLPLFFVLAVGAVLLAKNNSKENE